MVTRDIAEESFRYGEHEIIVDIYIDHTNAYKNLSGYNILTGPDGYAYWRIVYVTAVKDGHTELRNKTYVNEETDPSPPKTIKIPPFGEYTYKTAKTKTPIPEQVETTVRPVLEELDKLYEITHRDVEIDIDIAMERLKHEKSWVDIDEQMDEISKELEQAT